MGTRNDKNVGDNAFWHNSQTWIEPQDSAEAYFPSLPINYPEYAYELQWGERSGYSDTSIATANRLTVPAKFDMQPIFGYESCFRGGIRQNEWSYMGRCEVPRTQEIAKDPGKRTSTIAFAEEQGGIEGIKMKSVKTEAGVAQKQRQFACPFQKRDPFKHRDCFKLTLHRIKDVKQHLRRRHMQHKYYCPRCYGTFDNTRKRDEHNRSNTCTTLEEMPEFEGISDEQSRELNKCADRSLRIESQWFDIWKIIFPDHPPPLSPFLGSYLNEMAPMLRCLWKTEGIGILDSVLRQKPTEINKNLVHEVVEAVFNHLEEGAETSSS